MADIDEYLKKILSSRYGKDVRGAIHDSIDEINKIAETYQGGAEIARDEAVEAKDDAQTSEANAKTYEEKAEAIASTFDKAFIYMGTIAFADLTAQEATAKTGYTWNINEEFTTDDRFKEGSGQEYPSGTNVARTDDGMWDVLTGISEGSGIKKITAEEFLANEEYYRGSGKTYWISDGQNYILKASSMGFTPTDTLTATNVQGAVEEVDAKCIALNDSLAEIKNIKVVTKTFSGSLAGSATTSTTFTADSISGYTHIYNSIKTNSINVSVSSRRDYGVNTYTIFGNQTGSTQSFTATCNCIYVKD